MGSSPEKRGFIQKRLKFSAVVFPRGDLSFTLLLCNSTLIDDVLHLLSVQIGVNTKSDFVIDRARRWVVVVTHRWIVYATVVVVVVVGDEGGSGGGSDGGGRRRLSADITSYELPSSSPNVTFHVVVDLWVSYLLRLIALRTSPWKTLG
ncbi:hypothetical protein QVD17_39516 [Tagetes erecta]|uniref:Uncharacterized protein n=1 Tax=Tagetes erecta TaxID=13708 RepID=A0AAD8JNP0_TARER|nr:hypothetical protein QVD17_39516 [Tagetes erecta]